MNNILYKSQYGFRNGHPTNQATIKLQLFKTLKKRKSTLGAFLDLSKAFDSIEHKTPICKLNPYGIRGLALGWLRSYLTDYKQYTLFKRTRSEEETVTCGVPQGSVLGPLLFLIYVHNIPNSLTAATLIICDDDSTIYKGHTI